MCVLQGRAAFSLIAAAARDCSVVDGPAHLASARLSADVSDVTYGSEALSLEHVQSAVVALRTMMTVTMMMMMMMQLSSDDFVRVE